MALSDIIETIRADARKTASGALAAAEAQAERLLERARAEAAREEQRLGASLDNRARLERSRILSRANLEAANERRAAREKVYLAALDGVRRRLEEFRFSSEYPEVLSALFDEAISVLPTATVVRVDSADMETIERILSARDLDLRIESEEASLGGVGVFAERRAVDNYLRTRLERADEHLRYIAGELIPDLRGGVG